MAFDLHWTPRGKDDYDKLKAAAKEALASRKTARKSKSSKAEGLFKQVGKTVSFLTKDPKHTGLQTHEFDSLEHPYDPNGKVWEAYVQNNTPGAYRLFWCYGPGRGEITIIAITPHP